MTTFKVGGPARMAARNAFVARRSSTRCASRIAAASHVTLLGGGSNVLIGDRGVRGLVIRPRGGQIEQIEHASACARMRRRRSTGSCAGPIHRGIAGLEAWAGTPGTVGGAIYGNAHFGGRLIGELVESVRLADRDGHDARSFARRDGIRVRSKPLAENRRSAAVGGVRGSDRRSDGSS